MLGGPVLPAVAGVGAGNVGAGNVGAGNVADVPGGIDQPRRSGAAKGARYTIAKFRLQNFANFGGLVLGCIKTKLCK